MTTPATPQQIKIPWFTSGDVDGFFGLFFSGFPDLLLIVGLAPLCGLPVLFVVTRILQGTCSMHGRRGAWHCVRGARM